MKEKFLQACIDYPSLLPYFILLSTPEYSLRDRVGGLDCRVCSWLRPEHDAGKGGVSMGGLLTRGRMRASTFSMDG